MLTLPYTEWGRDPPPSDVIQKIIEQSGELASAFSYRRFVSMEIEHDKQQQFVLLLQERLRLHTQIVRNWGYFSAVVRISKELYSAIDQDLSNKFGFSATDFVEISQVLVSSFERRSNSRWRTLGEIFESQTTEQLVREYYAKYPDVEGDPDEFLASIPDGVTMEMVKYKLLSHADIALVKLAVVDVAELAELAGRAQGVVESVLSILVLSPGDLDVGRAEYFFLANPVWTSPGVLIGDEFFFPAPQVIFSHIHSILGSLAEAAGVKEKLEKVRAEFLEKKIKEIVEKALPGIHITSNAKWQLGDKIFETDLLGRIDRVVLIVEAKSAALTPQGLRGAPDRVKRHVRDLVVDPAQQSHRLEQVIQRAKDGDKTSINIASSLGLVPNDIDAVIRVSITLDDFSVVCSAEKELKAAGWAPDDLRLAPTLGIADFEVVADILSEPAYFLHYFSERERIQKTSDIFGDELDYLGFYLETGFNVASIENEKVALSISGMSHDIDHYYTSRDAGVIVPKPLPKVHAHVARIVESVRQRGAKAWAVMSLDILSLGSFEEQRALFKEMDRLRESVRKNYKNPRHLCSLRVSPPAHRLACVIFYVYPQALSERRQDIVVQLSGDALAGGKWKRCVFVGRKIEEWDRPYQFIGIATPPKE
ncbi:hypothetical protein [Burkholderia ambifaria]|uniref:NERD domain-containing protein n=1 Tax=Burkholderia ambifaria MEX-5 TaxID=396597 RepID=B1TG25_9BURK|nr:hypothetical protein [Burkholderia ambifaria]EDT37483.1 hypothetical protein BamMEX5DRAFT_6741 [Burkholderia ambifaria MEX-5]